MGVPVQRCELNSSVVALNHGHVHSVKLLDLEAPGIDEVVLAAVALALIVSLIVSITVLEGGQDGVELDLVLRKNGELIL